MLDRVPVYTNSKYRIYVSATLNAEGLGYYVMQNITTLVIEAKESLLPMLMMLADKLANLLLEHEQNGFISMDEDAYEYEDEDEDEAAPANPGLTH